MGPKYPSKSRQPTAMARRTPPPTTQLARARKTRVPVRRRQATGEIVRESVSPIYYPASRHFAVDGRDSSRRIRGLYAVACLGVTRGGLPHHSGGDVLPRRQS